MEAVKPPGPVQLKVPPITVPAVIIREVPAQTSGTDAGAVGADGIGFTTTPGIEVAELGQPARVVVAE